MKHVVITRDSYDEYRVPAPNGTEEAAYYTDDKADAIDTARLMWSTQGNIKVVVRRAKGGAYCNAV